MWQTRKARPGYVRERPETGMAGRIIGHGNDDPGNICTVLNHNLPDRIKIRTVRTLVEKPVKAAVSGKSLDNGAPENSSPELDRRLNA
jgi:hypothetical protein